MVLQIPKSPPKSIKYQLHCSFFFAQKREVVRKPGSVLDNHLSGNIITHIFKRFVERWRSSLAFRSILHSVGVYLADTSRYRRWSLTLRTCVHHRCTIACSLTVIGCLHFCGTILTVTRTGRYPATCSEVPGLSSLVKKRDYPTAS